LAEELFSLLCFLQEEQASVSAWSGSISLFPGRLSREEGEAGGLCAIGSLTAFLSACPIFPDDWILEVIGYSFSAFSVFDFVF
jgi:hypothetical protein